MFTFCEKVKKLVMNKQEKKKIIVHNKSLIFLLKKSPQYTEVVFKLDFNPKFDY